MKNKFRQSPININSHGNIDISKIGLLQTYYQNSITCDLMHTGNFLRLQKFENQYLIFNNTKYYLKDIHYHGPSEHKFNMEKSAVECHMVHFNEANNAILVLGIMIEKGSNESTHGIIFDSIPQYNQTKEITINLNDLIVEGGFYTYAGSLTTPPFTENVQWVVFRNKKYINENSVQNYLNNFPVNARKCHDCSNTIVFESRH